MSPDFSTADLFDADPDGVAVLDLDLRSFGGRARFAGPAATLRTPAHHGPLREILSRPGLGRVLVVDADGDRSTALLGDRIGRLAMDNGWAGIVLNGVLRDSRALASLDIGIRALGTTARRSSDSPPDARQDESVSLGGVMLWPGRWVYADEDAVIVAPRDMLGRRDA